MPKTQLLIASRLPLVLLDLGGHSANFFTYALSPIPQARKLRTPNPKRPYLY